MRSGQAVAHPACTGSRRASRSAGRADRLRRFARIWTTALLLAGCAPRPAPAAEAPRSRLVRVERGDVANASQVVIWLHGWGAPGDDLVALADRMRAPGRAHIFPAAPLERPGGGRAWWTLDPEQLAAMRAREEARRLPEPPPAEYLSAREAVRTLVAELSARAPDAEIVLGGFSQGAMMSAEVAIDAPADVDAVFLLSGAWLRPTVWEAAMRAAHPRRALVVHGRADTMLPFADGEATATALRTAGVDVTFVAHGGGHGIPPEALDALSRFLRSPR